MLLYWDSFDHYQNGQVLDKWTGAGAVTLFEVVVGAGRCGTNALRFPSLRSLFKGVTVGGTPNVGFAGVAMKVQLNLNGTKCFGVRNAGASFNNQWFAVLNPGGALEIYNGNSELQAVTPADVVRFGDFYYVEFGWVIHPSAGAITVRVNNVVVLQETGINLRYSGHANNNWTAAELANASNASWLADDFYVLDDVDSGDPNAPNNSFLGDSIVEYLPTIADGDVQQWQLAGSKPDAWDAVQDGDTPDEDDSYIHSETPDDLQLNVHEEPRFPTGKVFGVQVSLHAKKVEAGPRLIAPAVHHGGTTHLGADQSPSVDDYTYRHEAFNLNPETGVAWTLADLSGPTRAQFGVKVTT
jgi:hypothetical protein